MATPDISRPFILTPTVAGTIPGNEKGEQALSSMIELLTLRIWQNNEARNNFIFTKNTLPFTLLRNNTAIFRIPRRGVMRSTDADTYNSATQIKRTGVSQIIVQFKVDQLMEFGLTSETLDLATLGGSDADTIRIANILSQRLSSTIDSLSYNMEAFFLRGIIDFCIANSSTDITKEDWSGASPIIYVDPAQFVVSNLEYVKAIGWNIYQNFIRLIKKVDGTQIGTNMSNYNGILSYNAAATLGSIYRQSYGSTTTRDVYQKDLKKEWPGANGLNIYGKHFFEHFMLESTFKSPTTNQAAVADVGSALDDTLDFDFTNILGIVVHNRAIAFGLNFQTVVAMIEPDKANQLYLGKIIRSIPWFIKNGQAFIIYLGTVLDPTVVQAAQENVRAGDDSNKKTATFGIQSHFQKWVDVAPPPLNQFNKLKSQLKTKLTYEEYCDSYRKKEAREILRNAKKTYDKEFKINQEIVDPQDAKLDKKIGEKILNIIQNINVPPQTKEPIKE